MITRIFCYITLILLTISCGNNANTTSDSNQSENTQAETENQLWDEVMVIHDEVMPQMSAINKLTGKLKDQLQNNEELEEALKAKMEETLQDLQKADEGMWNWMHNLKQLGKLRESLDHKGIVNYLNEEKTKITKVKGDMLSSIEKGQELVKELDLSAD